MRCVVLFSSFVSTNKGVTSVLQGASNEAMLSPRHVCMQSCSAAGHARSSCAADSEIFIVTYFLYIDTNCHTIENDGLQWWMMHNKLTKQELMHQIFYWSVEPLYFTSSSSKIKIYFSSSVSLCVSYIVVMDHTIPHKMNKSTFMTQSCFSFRSGCLNLLSFFSIQVNDYLAVGTSKQSLF